MHLYFVHVTCAALKQRKGSQEQISARRNGKGWLIVANKIVATIRASTMISFLLEVSYLIIYYKVGVNQNLTVHKIINFKGCHIGL